jgi:two-component system, sensor histidine kinase and response regulator
MDDFISKPIEAHALWAAIDRVTRAFPQNGPRGSRLLDAETILHACGGLPKILGSLCHVLQSSLPNHVASVRSALDHRDLSRLSAAAYLVYGTIGAFSSVAGALALALEDTALRQDHESCAQLVAQLESMCTDLLEDTRDLTLEELEGDATQAAALVH